jgi:hypothetical protein
VSLFVVQHHHSPERCPAADPQMAPMLLTHLSSENSSKYGVSIHGEGVVDGAHTLYLILEAPDRAKVEEFMTPFAMAGEVSVQAASPCEVVVGRGAC